MPRLKTACRIALALFIGLLLFLPAVSVRAQDLILTLSNNTYAAYINSDGTVDIVQDLTFVVAPGSVPLDYVDVGLPNDTYDLVKARASLDGVPLANVSRSQNIAHGLKVVLGAHEIQPGQTGTLHIEATVRDVLYQDSKDKTYASLELSPTYFDSQFMRGTGRLEVQFHFPAGVTPDEPRYHGTPFTQASVQDDRVVYTWIVDNATGSQVSSFGASFPNKYLDPGVLRKAPAFTINWQSICRSPFLWIGVFIAVWAVLAAIGSRAQKRRKLEYLPPALAVEGAGVKRGLTAIEAAVLLEAPLNKVLTMILFGLVKKGAITVESDKPLNVKVVDPQPANTELWDYEQRFVKTIGPDGTPDEEQLRDLAVELVGDVNKKLAGFSRKETQAYYKDIAARAWQQVEAADTPEVLGKNWSDGLEWTMLDDDWNDHTRRVFQDRPVVLPTWWWGYRPWGLPVGAPVRPSVPLPSPAGGGMPVTLPTLPGADFANTVVGGIEKAANTVVSSIERFTGGVSQKTNPPPKESSSSSRSWSGRGGGYSCACACACAGCACACAGGGR